MSTTDVPKKLKMNTDSTNNIIADLKESKSKTMAINRDIFKSAKPKESNAMISVWDKMQAHDTNLYHEEQEIRRFKKR